ncbi:Agrobacterium tumefaciens protein [Bacillus cereus]|nr:Agrobacterium tumefaciens protein [Bacillus cereus]
MLDFGLPKIGILGMNCCPNGRYVEARGNVECAYTGHYQITDDHIEYQDNTGFTADGDFINGILYHAGMVLHRERS